MDLTEILTIVAFLLFILPAFGIKSKKGGKVSKGLPPLVRPLSVPDAAAKPPIDDLSSVEYSQAVEALPMRFDSLPKKFEQKTSSNRKAESIGEDSERKKQFRFDKKAFALYPELARPKYEDF